MPTDLVKLVTDEGQSVSSEGGPSSEPGAGGGLIEPDLSALKKPLEIVRQSYDDVSVNAGNSTLIWVDAVAAVESVSYQWLRNGHPLVEDEKYFIGTRKPILCVNNAMVASSGTYSCKVSISSESKTAEIKLGVNHTPFTDFLIKRYKSQAEVNQGSNKWLLKPAARGNTYINLALIQESASSDNKADELTLSTSQRDVDDIIKRKEKIEFENVFREYKSKFHSHRRSSREWKEHFSSQNHKRLGKRGVHLKGSKTCLPNIT